jgi:hypothetical protein
VTTAVLGEAVVRRAPLGLRFWDVAAGTPFLGSLDVAVRDELASGALGRRRRALVGRSGVHAVLDLPDDGRTAAALTSGTVPDRRARVEVEDPARRYLPFSVGVGLPTWQLAGTDCTDGSFSAPLGRPVAPAAFVPLFSAASRTLPPGRAVVRAHLRLAGDAAGADGPPARWSLVTVSAEAGPVACGLSGDDGQVVVVLPWPELSAGTPGSGGDLGSGLAEPVPLGRQIWSLDVGVHTDPVLAARLAPPDLCAVLDQPPAAVLQLSTHDLVYGREATLRSPGRSSVVVVPNA